VCGGDNRWRCGGGVHGAGGSQSGYSEAGGAARAWLLHCCRRSRLSVGSGGGLHQGVRIWATGGGVTVEARMARRHRRVRARDAAGDRAAGGNPVGYWLPGPISIAPLSQTPCAPHPLHTPAFHHRASAANPACVASTTHLALPSSPPRTRPPHHPRPKLLSLGIDGSPPASAPAHPDISGLRQRPFVHDLFPPPHMAVPPPPTVAPSTQGQLHPNVVQAARHPHPCGANNHVRQAADAADGCLRPI
jgi:hypothetical protein